MEYTILFRPVELLKTLVLETLKVIRTVVILPKHVLLLLFLDLVTFILQTFFRRYCRRNLPWGAISTYFERFLLHVSFEKDKLESYKDMLS